MRRRCAKPEKHKRLKRATGIFRSSSPGLAHWHEKEFSKGTKILLAQVGTLSFSHPVFGFILFARATFANSRERRSSLFGALEHVWHQASGQSPAQTPFTLSLS